MREQIVCASSGSKQIGSVSVEKFDSGGDVHCYGGHVAYYGSTDEQIGEVPRIGSCDYEQQINNENSGAVICTKDVAEQPPTMVDSMVKNQ
jgi:hypothetical protein